MNKKLLINLICLFLILFGFACSNNLEENQMPLNEKEVEIPDQESWDSKLITTDSGKITAEIEFGYMAKFNEKNEYKFEKNIIVKFYDEDGNVKSKINSDKGLLKENQKFMEVFGNVVAHSDSSNITLYTERLQWREDEDKISSNEEVKITTDYDTLFGLGFESDVDLKHWEIKKPHDGRSARKIGDDIDKHFETPKKK